MQRDSDSVKYFLQKFIDRRALSRPAKIISVHREDEWPTKYIEYLNDTNVCLQGITEPINLQVSFLWAQRLDCFLACFVYGREIG